MLKILVARLVKKHGLKYLIMKIGDLAVGITKTKKDDVAWAKVKKVLKGL